MTADQDKISAILDHLCDELARGNHFFQIAQALQRAYDGNRLTDAPYFFAGAYDACLRESILSLAKLTDSDQDSITIVYLLNIAKQNREAFQRAVPDESDMAVTRHQKLLKELRPLIASVKGQRDRVIAHLDRKHITRIIHQAEKSTKESTFDVRVSLSPTTSQAHHEPQSSP